MTTIAWIVSSINSETKTWFELRKLFRTKTMTITFLIIVLFFDVWLNDVKLRICQRLFQLNSKFLKLFIECYLKQIFDNWLDKKTIIYNWRWKTFTS